MMLEDIEKNAVDFKPNYDETVDEPITLPSKFPYLLCGNNSGIAVGMGSDLVSHNFTEVMGAIKYYMEHKDCSIADLMQFIKGPDFPTKGVIINGEELLNIYTTGHGAVKMCAHYDISKKGSKTLITFHDVPYGIEITDGIVAPLKKLVIDDGMDVFEDIYTECTNPEKQYYDIVVTLGKDANVAKCLEILFNKTRLADSIKINQNLIINGEPQMLNLKQMIEYWVNYRSNIIKRIAQTDYAKTNHKLTITLGLQKCMSNIDRVIQIVRFDDTPKATLMKEFSLNDEQADAVLEIKLARLSRLEVEKLNSDEKKLEEELARLNTIINDENNRYTIIKKDLDDIKKVLGADERLTEIHYARPNTAVENKPVVKEEYKIYSNGLHLVTETNNIEDNLVDVVFAYNSKDINYYDRNGTMSPIDAAKQDAIGAFVRSNKNKFVCVTKNGNIKVSVTSEYKWTKTDEKMLKLKDGDELMFADFCGDTDFLMLFNGTNVLKLSVKDLPCAGKLTLGVKSGFEHVLAAAVVSEGDNLLFVTKDNKGKLTPVKEFNIDSRGNKGQLVPENTIVMRKFEDARENIYIIPKTGKPLAVSRSKISIKSRTAIGAAITSRAVDKVI